MHLSLNETPFLYATVLRAGGLPDGALSAAVRMVQWAETFHGIGVRFLERSRRRPRRHDPAAVRIRAEQHNGYRIDAAGQSSLLIGPGLLDLACAKAARAGIGFVAVTGLRDLVWLGQLADQAARRSLAGFVAFAAEPSSAEHEDLCRLYSPGRCVVGIAGAAAPSWLELPAATAVHARLLGPEADGEFKLDARELLEPRPEAPVGATIICLSLGSAGRAAWAADVRQAGALDGARHLEPAAVLALRQRAVVAGFDVPAEDYYPLARYGLTTVVPTSAESRAQAGASS